MTKLYHGAGGWQVPGQQDKDAQRVDVPNPPELLAAWLNERGVQADGTIPDHEVVPTGSTFDTPPASDPCPKCKMTPRHAKTIAQHRLRSADTEAKERWILEEADPWTLGRLAGAVAMRFRDLAERD